MDIKLEKIIPEVVNNVATGKYVKVQATWIDVLNPTVALTGTAKIAQVAAYAGLAYLLAED